MDRQTYLDNLKTRAKQYRDSFLARSDEAMADRYTQEMRNLKMICLWQGQGRPGKRPCSYPGTWIINACRYELKRRGLSIPQVR